MSEQREALAAVLRAHRSQGSYSIDWCSCNSVEPVTFDRRQRPNMARLHRAHLADVILREWLPAALADERVVEAAAEGMHGTTDARSVPYARAALSAAVTALTEGAS